MLVACRLAVYPRLGTLCGRQTTRNVDPTLMGPAKRMAANHNNLARPSKCAPARLWADPLRATKGP
jgi:hypothetical protein